MHARDCVLVLLFVAAPAISTGAESGRSGSSAPAAPFELVKSRVDIDANADGSYAEAEETAFRILDFRGQKALQKTTLSYTDGLQSLRVEAAYTLKANGEKIPVPENQMLEGSGATSAHGFEDQKTLTILFPKLEVGDEVVLSTLRKQLVPLFAGQFAIRRDYRPAVKADDVQLTLTAPATGLALKIEAVGVEGAEREAYAGKYRWVWRYHNDAPVTYALDSVVATDDQPHVIASSFPSYEAVARAYADHFQGKSAVNPEIQSLANRLTTGLSDRRAQAKALYDWVSSNISYVNIVLGAGGFTPHAAADVLALRYGDCKDHVMLLQALLAARGIPSNPALIEAGGPYVLSQVPSAFYFNHLITYVPELRLYLDSTAHYAPFGVLPFMDADRPVVLVPSGEVSGTPNVTADETTGSGTTTIKFDSDGTAQGDSRISLTGNAALIQRSIIDPVPPDREKEIFQIALGPGSEGTIDRGNLQSLSDPFTYSIHFRLPSAANFSGPGAISTALAIGPLSSAVRTFGILPASRQVPYTCPSLNAAEDATFEFPSAVQVTSVPNAVSIADDGVEFKMHYQVRDAHTVTGTSSLRLDHPRAFCTPDYYSKIRSDLARIAASRRAQILYK